MPTNILTYLIGVAGLGFFIVVAIFIYSKIKAKNSKTKYLKTLVQGTQTKKYSIEIFYQKYYLFCLSVPILKRYTEKLRRRIEIINLGDEYLTRQETAKIMARVLPTVIISFILVIIFAKGNLLLTASLILILAFLTETLISGAVDKVENKLLKQQLDFFAEIRHAYHEFNMVEEAIYEVAQNDELPEVSRQAERIHEILLSDEPENELEKYYDIAPNDFLKEFAGISYLTREFGDRKDENGSSLYLKNLNNITQEMQIEILKRDKLDYVFQSLSLIALAPVLFIEPIKGWAINTFAFTKQFYNGKLGLIMQIFLIILTTVSFVLVRKLRDNSRPDNVNSTSNPWQNKIYKKKIFQEIINAFIPKKNTKEYRQKIKLLKESASKLKLEWFYTTKVTLFTITFIITLLLSFATHVIARNYVYTEPTSDYNLVGNMGNVDDKKAIEKTKRQNIILKKLEKKSLKDKKELSEALNKLNKSKTPGANKKEKVNLNIILKEMEKIKEYKLISGKDREKEAEQIIKKYKVLSSENFSWIELVITIIFSFIAYHAPEMILKFQLKMRELEMENEVMQFHTIILMLMKIERVNVEMMLEWIERYSNIFREPISKCVNNFESGPYEALEELKNDITFPKFVRIVESLQAAVDQIPIREAFDELETERAYYQEKRKESNERLIAKKARIGKAIGFTPMIVLFVGYLIIPMVGIGVVSMSETLSVLEAGGAT